MTEPLDPDFERRVRDSFARQSVMATIGATLESVAAGVVSIQLSYSDRLTQQNGYVHAGIITTIVDSACGYAACTLAPVGWNVLTVEYKVNFIAPAKGELFVATGKVLKAGRTLTVCQGEVAAHSSTGSSVVAVILATIMTLPPK